MNINPAVVRVGMLIPYACVREEQPLGTDGGTFTAGAWQARTLNTKQHDGQNIVALSANRMTLAAGTYICEIAAPAYNTNFVQARLQNVTDATTVLLGMSQYCGSVFGNGMLSGYVWGKFTIAAGKQLEVQQQCSTTSATYGFGVAAGFTTEIYTIVELWKVA